MSKKEIDELSGIDTTGHEWDGLKELNHPLPRWWLWVFYACILWGIGYWVLYPAFPLPGGFTHGTLNYNSRDAVMAEVQRFRDMQKPMMEKIAATDLAAIKKDPELLRFAMAAGKSAFGVNCAGCHGVGAQGSRGFPNLNDDDWIWGGKIADINQTITHGVRWQTDAETRMNMMTAFVKDGVLTKDQAGQVVEYVLSLSKQDHDAQAAAAGKTVFADNCVACHTEAGTGNAELGAPNLTDGIWLYGGDRVALMDTVTNGRGGVMPAFTERLDAATIKTLAVYVHSLGGGVVEEKTASAATP